MKIGIVLYPTMGGSGVLATELGIALANKGHQIHFITYRQPVRLSAFNANIFYHEVRVPTYPLFDYPPYETALASTMVDVAVNHQLDLLHVHYAIPHANAAHTAKQIILKKTGKYVPVVTTLHGTDITLVGRDNTYLPVVEFSINESDVITAVSNNLSDETYKAFNIEKKIDVIYNFVDVKRFSKKPIDAFKKAIAPNGERILVHASNFRAVKRVQDIIRVFYEIQKEVPAKLLMVGDGPERHDAENLVRELGIAHKVNFTGKQDQIEEIMAISDLFLLLSEYESFGLSALEAMAASVPVLSSNAGGIPEVNVNGVTGYLADIGDIDQLSKYGIDILKDDETLKVFKENAYKHAESFDIQHIIPKYEHLYQSVLNQSIH
ncbi:N-acetyl-alpha-D-glucosaminyl L-malate synthase BshA [Polluticaenibacter yanchengensis]|uniref:N-acetyl-alpha-D-glucosaminyl L-malate synthase BshA n=1 Tax=Polluticaenibacter yanchengensis TaxID=3014562 RepID=A0ABT4UK87_9BACT|nr:N-acetyl-alpha-D-glucosaminyl L-malate synthase BshA [Chitinophagaceae bacterium LY-5]